MVTRVASYTIMSDYPITLKRGDDIDHTFNFNLPEGAEKVSAILGFKIDPISPRNLVLRIEVNGIFDYAFSINTDVICSQHEVIPFRSLKAGQNSLTMKLTGGEGGVKIGDVVLLFQKPV